jgi:AbrB family looped-hinge helix DNA binding protein
MSHYATLTSKGQLTIPKEVRDQLALGPGDTIVWTVVNDHLVGIAKNLDFADLAGLLGDAPVASASLDEIDAAVRTAVGEHVAGRPTNEREAAE